MSKISAWSKTAASNNAAPPDGWPEGQLPSTVNNCARENMAAIRTWYEDAEWLDYGFSYSRESATKFSVTSNTSTATAWFLINRRIKAIDGANTLYGYVTEASISGSSTNITVALDSGSLTSSLSTVSVNILSTNDQILQGLSLSSVASLATGDGVIILDANDSNLPKKTTVQTIADFASTVQVVSGVTSTDTSTTTAMPFDDTIPQNTEGAELVTVTITPTSATSTLVILAHGYFSASTDTNVSVALFQDSTADALRASSCWATGVNQGVQLLINHAMTSGTTSATTFKLRFGISSGSTAYALQNAAGSIFSTVNQAQIIIFEVIS